MSKSRQHQGHTTQAGPSAAPERWPGWIATTAWVLLIAGASYALFHYVILTRVPHHMIGTWLVVGGDMDGARLEFTRDGAMTGVVNMKGKAGKIEAKVEVENDTLRITSVNPYTNQPETDVQTIRVLRDDEFVIEDRKGTVMKMQRLRQ
jgi:hypothetical protein